MLQYGPSDISKGGGVGNNLQSRSLMDLPCEFHATAGHTI